MRIAREHHHFFLAITTLILCLTIAIGAWKLFYYTTPIVSPQENNLLGIQWQDKETPSLSFIRLSDGAEERLSGSWKSVFTAPDEVAVFGSFADDTAATYRFYLVSPRGSKEKTIDSSYASLHTVSTNRVRTYILLEGSNTDIFPCVAEKLTPHITPCIQLKGKAQWNPLKDRELIIETHDASGTTSWFSYDPWEDTPQPISAQYAQQQLTIAGPPDHPARRFTLSRFLNIVTIYDTKNRQRAWFSAPSRSTLTWSDPYHLVFHKGATLYGIDARTGYKNRIMTLPGIPTNIFSYYSPAS